MSISERSSRALYVVELVLFAVFPTFVLAAWTVLVGSSALFVFLSSFPMLAASTLFDIQQTPGEALLLMALSGGGAGLAGMGATALVKFVSLSAIFVRRGTAELRRHRQELWRCLAWAALPLIATNALFPDKAMVFGFLAYGLTLGVPLIHLWAEMRYRPL